MLAIQRRPPEVFHYDNRLFVQVSKKSEKITAFGGIFFVLDKFDHILSSVIDSHHNRPTLTIVNIRLGQMIAASTEVSLCGSYGGGSIESRDNDSFWDDEE